MLLLCSFSINFDATIFIVGVIVFSSGLYDGYDRGSTRLMSHQSHGSAMKNHIRKEILETFQSTLTIGNSGEFVTAANTVLSRTL